MLVIGSGFDQMTEFRIHKPDSENPDRETAEIDAADVTVLTPNIAVIRRAPASPDGEPGLAQLEAENTWGTAQITVEYVTTPPPIMAHVDGSSPRMKVSADTAARVTAPTSADNAPYSPSA